MPIMPFHFGPGLLFRAVTRHVSLSAFVLVNCVIDIEPILAFLLTGDPQHRFLHTYLGATVAATIVGQLGRKPLEIGLRYWNRQLSSVQARWLGCNETLPVPALWAGALLGAWSHVWLDAFMHVDVAPWWPMTSGNLQQGRIGMTALHALCVAAGLAGLLLLSWQRIKANFPRVATVSKWSGWMVNACHGGASLARLATYAFSDLVVRGWLLPTPTTAVADALPGTADALRAIQGAATQAGEAIRQALEAETKKAAETVKQLSASYKQVAADIKAIWDARVAEIESNYKRQEAAAQTAARSESAAIRESAQALLAAEREKLAAVETGARQMESH